MPIYEYCCRSCGARFEALVRGSETPACSECGSTDLERMLSLFGVSSEGTRHANREQGKAALKRANRDQVIATREQMDKHHH